mgnify:CR=1 FL=1
MSKVYHGSIEEVRNPEIRQPNRSLDYIFHTEKSLLAIKFVESKIIKL